MKQLVEEYGGVILGVVVVTGIFVTFSLIFPKLREFAEMYMSTVISQ